LPISALTQRAIEDALAAERTRDWAQRVRERAARCRKRIDTVAMLDEVREDFGQ
jgi:post-segregation antitoxin (ccd killing protein)